MNEERCAALIATVRGFGRAPLGGVYLTPPGDYSPDEIRDAQESCDRLDLRWKIQEGTITVTDQRGTMAGPHSIEFVE